MIVNIAALAYFKYADFIVDNINFISKADFPRPNVALPLAISFFTFQQIAYLADSYKGITKEYDFLTYALFVTFFPQLIAGPIVAHYEMMPQFANIRNFVKNYRHIFQGVCLFLVGLGKKIFIADYFARYASIGFDKIDNLTLVGGWLTSLSYSIQIYFDFSGYCDMAIGLGLMFNIKLPVNFDSPYKATNIQDFWRRWHITLSRFLRDYIYIPLGGNRQGERRAFANVFAVFLIGGLWHGAAYTFVIWGAAHGMANIIWRIWRKTQLKLNKYLAWFITFNFVNIAWVFFRATSFADAGKVLYAMFDVTSLFGLPRFSAAYYLAGFEVHTVILFKLAAVIAACVLLPNSMEIMRRINLTSPRQAIIYGILGAIVAVLLLAKMAIVPYSEFIYFNF